MSETLGWDAAQITHKENRSQPSDQSPTLNQDGKMSILYTGDSPAKTSAWPVNGQALGASVALSGMSSTGCCQSCGHDGRSLRMSRDFYQVIQDMTSEFSSPGWMNSGTMQAGRYWTHSTSESRNVADACSLSQVLEDEVPSKYYLSARAATEILRRANRRSKNLPLHLQQALEALACGVLLPESANA